MGEMGRGCINSYLRGGCDLNDDETNKWLIED